LVYTDPYETNPKLATIEWDDIKIVFLFINWQDKQVFNEDVKWKFSASTWWWNHWLKAFFNNSEDSSVANAWDYYVDNNGSSRVYKNFYSGWYWVWSRKWWFKLFSKWLKLNDRYTNNYWYQYWRDSNHQVWSWQNYNPSWTYLMYSADKNYYCDKSTNLWKDQSWIDMWTIYCKWFVEAPSLISYSFPKLTDSNRSSFPITITAKDFWKTNFADSLAISYTFDYINYQTPIAAGATNLTNTINIDMTWKDIKDLSIYVRSCTWLDRYNNSWYWCSSHYDDKHVKFISDVGTWWNTYNF
jgi:hypothetical protein